MSEGEDYDDMVAQNSSAVAESMAEYQEQFNEFMTGIQDHMTNLVKESYKAPQGIRQEWQAFSAAINWKDQLIQGLMAFNVILLVLVLALRKYFYVQVFIFAIITFCVSMAARINQWCHDHWREIASQDYFDAHGVFAGIFFCGPLLFIAFVQLVSRLSISIVRPKLLRLPAVSLFA